MENLKTFFAPPERLSREEVFKQFNKITHSSVFSILNKIPVTVLILNKYRQVVYGNEYFKKIAKLDELSQVLGMRPGEVFKCQYSDINEAGCGTSKFCKYCGAVNAILTSLKGVKEVRECNIVTKTGEALILQVNAEPFDFDNDNYTVFSIMDISIEKRKEFLETFFLSSLKEDISNIYLSTNILQDIAQYSEIVYEIKKLSEKLLAQIDNQKLIFDAENFKIKVNPIKINSKSLIREIISKFNYIEKLIDIGSDCEDIEFTTDYNLIFIIVEQLLKYSIKNRSKNEIVKISSSLINNKVTFKISNKQYISLKKQHSLFHKKFSNQLESKELEMYLIKLLITRYLKGDITLISNKEEGSTFFLTFPMDLSKEIKAGVK